MKYQSFFIAFNFCDTSKEISPFYAKPAFGIKIIVFVFCYKNQCFSIKNYRKRDRKVAFLTIFVYFNTVFGIPVFDQNGLLKKYTKSLILQGPQTL